MFSCCVNSFFLTAIIVFIRIALILVITSFLCTYYSLIYRAKCLIFYLPSLFSIVLSQSVRLLSLSACLFVSVSQSVSQTESVSQQTIWLSVSVCLPVCLSVISPYSWIGLWVWTVECSTVGKERDEILWEGKGSSDRQRSQRDRANLLSRQSPIHTQRCRHLLMDLFLSRASPKRDANNGFRLRKEDSIMQTIRGGRSSSCVKWYRYLGN